MSRKRRPPNSRVARGLLLALCLLLSACGVHSHVQLITKPDVPTEKLAGKWHPYLVHAAEDAKALPADVQRACLELGYQGHERDPVTQKHTGKPIETRYCRVDWDGKPITDATLVRTADTFNRLDDDSVGTIWFLTLGGGVYLAQEEGSQPGKPFYRYWMFRFLKPRVEIYYLDCEDFPTGKADDHGCAIDSIQKVRPELDAFAAKIRANTAAPIMVLTPAD